MDHGHLKAASDDVVGDPSPGKLDSDSNVEMRWIRSRRCQVPETKRCSTDQTPTQICTVLTRPQGTVGMGNQEDGSGGDETLLWACSETDAAGCPLLGFV